METKFATKEAARFLRTLQVTTGVAVALEDIRRNRARAAPAASFMALAAFTGEWRFPDEGLMSGDGLLLAKRERAADGAGALVLQAQGAAGVSAYAGRGARVRVGETFAAEGAFDRFGAMRLPLAVDELEDADLARFEVEFLDLGVMTARVFVPLVDAHGEAAHLFEAIAGEIPPEDHPARLVPQIAELFDFGLYGVGQSAREAVMSFIEARRRRLWLSPRNSNLKPWHLRISDLQLGRLGDGNARSAGLGLAIAALCQTFSRDPGVMFATGEILPPQQPGANAAAVGAVSGLRGKLALIGDYLSQHGPALEGQRVVVALPALADDGRPLAEVERGMLSRLREEADQARVRLDVVFADTLDALEPALGPFQIPELVTPARALATSVVVGAAAVVIGVWAALAHAPIRLAFEPPATGGAGGVDEAAPQRARYDIKTDKLELLGPCFDAQREPLVVGGETLVLKVRAEDGLPLASRVRPMRLFIASVSRNADPVILDAAHFRPLAAKPDPDANDLVAAIPIEPVEDEVRLFVLATRDPALAISDVEAALRSALKGLTGAAALAATTSFLADRVGAEIAYQFRVTNDRKACAA